MTKQSQQTHKYQAGKHQAEPAKPHGTSTPPMVTLCSSVASKQKKIAAHGAQRHKYTSPMIRFVMDPYLGIRYSFRNSSLCYSLSCSLLHVSTISWNVHDHPRALTVLMSERRVMNLLVLSPYLVHFAFAISLLQTTSPRRIPEAGA